MNIALSQPIAAYIEATNARNTSALLATLTPDAVVQDEGQTYYGIEEIKRWKAATEKKYQFTVEATNVVEEEHKTVVTTQVSGNFSGSPVQLHFHFTLKGDKITALSILD